MLSMGTVKLREGWLTGLQSAQPERRITTQQRCSGHRDMLLPVVTLLISLISSL